MTEKDIINMIREDKWMMDVLITTKGTNAYIISVYGMTQGDFDMFLSSFQFID